MYAYLFCLTNICTLSINPTGGEYVAKHQYVYFQNKTQIIQDGKAWLKEKVFHLFRNDCEDLDFLISRGIQFQSWGGGGCATEKSLSPILELALGTTS